MIYVRRVLCGSNTVQSSAIQTDLNEYVMPSCSSNALEYEAASVSHCQQTISKGKPKINILLVITYF